MPKFDKMGSRQIIGSSLSFNNEVLSIDPKFNFVILLLLWKVELIFSTIDLLNETHHMAGLFPLFIWLNITCYFKGYNLQL